MELTEFLLARIAEDEDRARKLMRRAQEYDLVVRDPQHLGKFMPGWHEWRDIESDAGRVLAECAAKRRIVEVHQPLPDDPEPFCWNCDEETWPCKTMAALAAVYADHPDFDPSWRV